MKIKEFMSAMAESVDIGPTGFIVLVLQPTGLIVPEAFSTQEVFDQDAP